MSEVSDADVRCVVWVCEVDVDVRCLMLVYDVAVGFTQHSIVISF